MPGRREAMLDRHGKLYKICVFACVPFVPVLRFVTDLVIVGVFVPASLFAGICYPKETGFLDH
ncbi:MAG: hypothetical protein WCW16_03595 [Candidatus Magasanikbacteria bacterium]